MWLYAQKGDWETYIFTDYNMVARAILGFIAAWGQGHIAWWPEQPCCNLFIIPKVPTLFFELQFFPTIFEQKNFFNQKFFYWPLADYKSNSTKFNNSTKKNFNPNLFYWPLAGHKSLYGPLSYLAGHIGIYDPLLEQSDWTISVLGIINIFITGLWI